jgi:hypothetical protein
MEDAQLDSFLEFVSLVEEGSDEFSASQVQKLNLIRTKVTALVNRPQASVQPVQTMQPAMAIQEVKKGVHEFKLQSFDEYVAVNEKIKKSGTNFVVTDKTGKKLLGKHPTKKKAVKQLQAIEISKAKAKGK